MVRPRIKDVHFPLRLSDGRILIGSTQYGVAAEITGDESGEIWQLLGLMDGTRDAAAIMAESAQRLPHVDPNSLSDAIAALIAAGYVEDAAAPAPPQLCQAEIERYETNTRYFAWVDTTSRPSPYDAQRRLKDAQVAVLGMGGTGGAMAMSLAAAGVGSLLCLDFDVVELSNLSRQLLYRDRDLGRSKVETAVVRLREVNPHVDVCGRELHVTSADDLEGIMREVDFFALCADQPPGYIELWTNEAALRTATPWLVCAYDGPTIVVGTFVPFATLCMECFRASVRDDNLRRHGSSAQPLLPPPANAVIAPAANASGHVGALEVIYHLTGLAPHTIGRILHQDLMHYDHVYYLEPPRRPECPVCAQRHAPGQRRPIPPVDA